MTSFMTSYRLSMALRYTVNHLTRKRLLTSTMLMIFIVGILIWQLTLATIKYEEISYIEPVESRSAVLLENFRINPTEIVIISVTDAAYRQRGIQQQNASLYCYACHHRNYRFISIDVNEYYICSRFENRGFSKPCVILRYMLDNPHIEWILLLDADIGVVNLTRRLENYLPSKDEQDLHIIFYERFNGEIQSAGYLIRNHPWSHRFLAGWLDWIPRTERLIVGAGDNGALHMHILDHVEDVSKAKRDQCWRVFQMVTPYNKTYHDYIGCVKCALGYRWTFKHIRILRRGHGFARDPNLGSVLFPAHDLFIHGDKNNMTDFYFTEIDTSKCCHDTRWQLPIRKDLFLYDTKQLRQSILNLDQAIADDLPMNIGVPDIGHCWPHCTSTPSQYWRERFFNKVCTNVPWLNV